MSQLALFPPPCELCGGEQTVAEANYETPYGGSRLICEGCYTQSHVPDRLPHPEPLFTLEDDEPCTSDA